MRGVAGAGVVEARGAAHLEGDLPLDDAQHAENVMPVGRFVLAFGDGHKVSDFGDPAIRIGNA